MPPEKASSAPLKGLLRRARGESRSGREASKDSNSFKRSETETRAGGVEWDFGGEEMGGGLRESVEER